MPIYCCFGVSWLFLFLLTENKSRGFELVATVAFGRPCFSLSYASVHCLRARFALRGSGCTNGGAHSIVFTDDVWCVFFGRAVVIPGSAALASGFAMTWCHSCCHVAAGEWRRTGTSHGVCLGACEFIKYRNNKDFKKKKSYLSSDVSEGMAFITILDRLSGGCSLKCVNTQLISLHNLLIAANRCNGIKI